MASQKTPPEPVTERPGDVCYHAFVVTVLQEQQTLGSSRWHLPEVGVEVGLGTESGRR